MIQSLIILLFRIETGSQSFQQQKIGFRFSLFSYIQTKSPFLLSG